MKRKTLLLLVALCGVSLVSCDEEEYVDKYTVIWQNDYGDILEIDRNVIEGTLPSYDGVTPTKNSDDLYTYTFSSWEPEIKPVTENTTYTAVFEKHAIEEVKNKYTVTWVNYDGTVLEIDENVLEGTMPSYDGDMPSKPSGDSYSCIFNGWSPELKVVTENITYTATFKEVFTGDFVPGVDPVLSNDQKIIEYGFYPQSHVNDTNLITQLNNLKSPDTNGWYLYNGEYYAKEEAQVFNNETYTFDDGVTISNGTEYWFKCETIKWQVLGNDNGTFFLVSSTLLDTHNFYQNYENRTIDEKTIYANNYEHSDIRTWLNNDFYAKAFNLNNTYIKETTLDNSSSTTDTLDNAYISENTTDKVYLPSYQDYLKSSYGFEDQTSTTSKSRQCKTSDYARARGAFVSKSKGFENNGSYWTRSPSSEYAYCAWNVNSGGYLSSYAVDGNAHSVRPSISLNIA